MKTCSRCHAYPYKDGPCFASDCSQEQKVSNPHLDKLKQNLQAADDAMRRHPNGGTPNRSWVGEQLMLIRLIEEAGFISGEWDGLFVGLLDDLMVLNRHRQRQIEQAANGEYEDRVRLIGEFMRTDANINEKSGEFIRKFGDRLALKVQP